MAENAIERQVRLAREQVARAQKAERDAKARDARRQEDFDNGDNGAANR
jgi:hypothetical protein